MVYDGIRDVDLAEACVELTVWDRDRLASHLLGGLRLGVGTGESDKRIGFSLVQNGLFKSSLTQWGSFVLCRQKLRNRGGLDGLHPSRAGPVGEDEGQPQ